MIRKTSYHEKIDVVVRACVRANPDLATKMDGTAPSAFASQVRLADVAFAILHIPSQRASAKALEQVHFWWNLKADSLLRQSDECVGFVYDHLQGTSTLG